jgi:hypothetical protein
MEMSFFVMPFCREAMHMRNMGMSFFVVCPVRNCECKAPKIGMNCNQSLIIPFPLDSSRFSGQTSRVYKACPGATSIITFLVRNEYGIFSVILSPCKPGLGQGHNTKKDISMFHAKKDISMPFPIFSFSGVVRYPLSRKEW